MDHMDNDPNPLYLEFNFDTNFGLNFPQRLTANSTISQHHPDFYSSHDEFYQQYDPQQLQQQLPADHQQYVYNPLEYVTATTTQQQPYQHFQPQPGIIGDHHAHHQQYALDGFTIEMAPDELQYIGDNNFTNEGVPMLVQQMKRETADDCGRIAAERIIISTPRMVKQPAVVRRQTEVQSHGQQTRGSHGRKQPLIGLRQRYDDDYTFQFGGVQSADNVESIGGGGGDEEDDVADTVKPTATTTPDDVVLDNDEPSFIVMTTVSRSAVEQSWTPVRPSKRLLEKAWMPKSKKRLLTAINTPEEAE